MRSIAVAGSLAALAILASPRVGAAAPSDASARLKQVFDEGWERNLRENPLAATYLGDTRYDALWPDVSPAALARYNAEDKATVATIDAFDPATLNADDRLNRDLFRRMYDDGLEAYAYGNQYLAVNHMEGVQTEDQLVELLQFTSVKDYENWLSRLQSIDKYVDQNIALLREGVAKGLVQPKVIMERVPPQVQAHIVDDPTKSKFYVPFVNMPASIPAAEQQRLRTAATAAIRDHVVPAYKRLHEYLVKDYLPKCRDTVGIWDTPGGDAWYQQRIHWHTTTNLTADQIHELGLKEVERIRGEMQKVVDRVGYKARCRSSCSTCAPIRSSVTRIPQQLYTAYVAMAKRIDPLLPQYFGHLPRIAVRCASDPRQRGAGPDDGVLPGPIGRRAACGLLLREPVQARGTANLRDPRADDPRGGARPPPADRAGAGDG
jgi:uncharacterized protein (DUF885 family)